MPQTILVERGRQITIIQLNRPQVLNAVNPTMHLELQAAFDAFAADDRQRICVVTAPAHGRFASEATSRQAPASKDFNIPKTQD